jgi:ankyrin repeat protein
LYRRETVGLKAEIRCYSIHAFMYKYKLIYIETWRFVVNMHISRSGELPGSNDPLTRELRKYRNWLRSLLLVTLLSVGVVSYAGSIHDAAKSGDLEQIQRLVVKGVDVNEQTTRDETPLIIAALAGKGEVVNYLLQRGADINAKSASGLTALHAAAYAGQPEIVSLLVAKGAAVNDASNRFETTPLHMASEENQIETVKALLGHGADVTAVEINGYNATSQAGWREHWDVLKLLLANGAACQAADIAGDWLYGECTARTSSN